MAEVDESNGEEKSEPVSEMETSVKGQHSGYILSPVFSRHFSYKLSLHVGPIRRQTHNPLSETSGV